MRSQPTISLAVLAVAALAVSACGRPSVEGWKKLGPCVWNRLPASDRANAMSAVENGRPVVDGPAGMALRDATRKLAFSCSPGAHIDEPRAGRIVSTALTEEAAAALIARDLGLSRQRLDAGIDLAPAPVIAQIRIASAQMLAGDPNAAAPPMTPIYAAMGLPQDPAFADSREGTWVLQYVLTRGMVEALAQGGAKGG